MGIIIHRMEIGGFEPEMTKAPESTAQNINTFWQANIRLIAERDAAIARAEKAEAECRESVMQSLASMGQAQDAYEAQVKAEAALARHLKYRDPFETP